MLYVNLILKFEAMDYEMLKTNASAMENSGKIVWKPRSIFFRLNDPLNLMCSLLRLDCSVPMRLRRTKQKSPSPSSTVFRVIKTFSLSKAKTPLFDRGKSSSSSSLEFLPDPSYLDILANL